MGELPNTPPCHHTLSGCGLPILQQGSSCPNFTSFAPAPGSGIDGCVSYSEHSQIEEGKAVLAAEPISLLPSSP